MVISLEAQTIRAIVQLALDLTWVPPVSTPLQAEKGKHVSFMVTVTGYTGAVV